MLGHKNNGKTKTPFFGYGLKNAILLPSVTMCRHKAMWISRPSWENKSLELENHPRRLGQLVEAKRSKRGKTRSDESFQEGLAFHHSEVCRVYFVSPRGWFETESRG